MQIFVLFYLISISFVVCECSTGRSFPNSSIYNGVSDVFKVYRVFLQKWSDVKQADNLRSLAEEGQIDIWLDRRRPGRYLEIMVSNEVEPHFLKLLSKSGLTYKVTIQNVQKLIKEREKAPLVKNGKHSQNCNETNQDVRAFFKRRLRDSTMSETPKFVGRGRYFEKVGEIKAQYFFGQYNSYSSMTRYMRTIEFYYPHIARLVRIGVTHEGRPIEGLKIGYPISNVTKRAMWIDGNIHAREWASSHTALFMINQLVAGYGKDKTITHYLNSLNFFIFPCLNPDGYEYSRSSLSPEIRLWRKNRSPEKCVMSTWGGWRCCQGVDLNRNFDFHWAEIGSSSNPCSNLYAGESAFSEPESEAVSKFLQSKNLQGRIDGFISLHTYAQFWIHPFSHEARYYPPDLTRIKSLADKAVNRLRDVYGTEYEIGTGADLLAPASGGSDDWAKESLGIRYVYLVELRPHNDFSNGFILNQEELMPTAIETFEAVKVVIDAILVDNGITRSTRLFFDNTTQQPQTTERSALYLVKSQATLFKHPTLNSSVTTMVDAQLNTFFQTMTSSTTVMSTETTTSSTTTMSTETTTSSTTTMSTETTASSTTTMSTETTTSSTTPSTHPILTVNFPVTVVASISIVNQTGASPPTTTSSNIFTDGLPLTHRQRLSEELLRKQLLRIQEINSLKRSTQQLPANTTSSPQTTSLVFTSTRRYGPRFLTPPLTTVSRPPTPLSYSSQSTTPLPMRLPPIIPPRLSGSANVRAPFAIAPTTMFKSTTTNKFCRDRKYSCVFWISADPYVCEDQRSFMERNCQFSCKFCTQN